MIVIVTSNTRERSAFAAMCEQREWPYLTCDSQRAFKHVLARVTPTVVLTRYRLADGYSDEIFEALRPFRELWEAKVIVLVPASMTSVQEARQVALGASCVLRDPVRTEVLVEYMKRAKPTTPVRSDGGSKPVVRLFQIAGAMINPTDRTLRLEEKVRVLTPREVHLAQLLANAPDDVVSYADLYTEILGRPFRGETSNMRVLLGKTCASFRKLGINLRGHIEVIPKSGYRYLPIPSTSAKSHEPRGRAA